MEIPEAIRLFDVPVTDRLHYCDTYWLIEVVEKTGYRHRHIARFLVTSPEGMTFLELEEKNRESVIAQYAPIGEPSVCFLLQAFELTIQEVLVG